MKYRSRTDITVLILEAANGGATKTKIMYKSFLSYAQLKEYLLFLVEKGLVEEYHRQKKEEDKNEKTSIGDERLNYKITEKGLQLLQICDEINGIIGQR